MAKPLDPSQYEVEAQAQQAQPMQAAQTLKPLNAAQYEMAPLHADGGSPMTPLNLSPLSVEERFKLGLANDQGRVGFLKQRFPEGVTQDDSGDFVVREKGSWHRMDGKAFGDVDAWTATKSTVKGLMAVGASISGFGQVGDMITKGDQGAQGIQQTAKSLYWLTFGNEKRALQEAESNPVSKELMSEYAENSPTLAKAGVSAVAATASGGMTIPAQLALAVGTGGVLKASETSLGRLEGTYQASPEEQLYDVGFESILNMAGVLIPLGVKPSASWVAKHLPAVAETIKKAGTVPAGLLKDTYAAISVGADNFETMLEHAPIVSYAMKSARAAVNSDTGRYVDHLTNLSIQQVKKASGNAQGMLSDIYKGLSKTMVSQVDDTFRADLQDITGNIFRKGIDDGFLTIKTPAGMLSPAEAAQLMADQGGKLPAWAKPTLRSMDEIKDVIRKTGDLSGGDIVFDKEAYKHMSNFFNKSLDLHGVKSLNGKAGFEQLMHFNKILDDATYAIKVKAEDSGLSAVARQMARYNDEIVSKAVGSKLEAQGLGKLYGQMQSTYSSMKNELAPLLSAREQALRGAGDRAYEQVLGKMSSREGKNVAVKEGIHAAIAAAEKFGSGYAPMFREVQKSIRINNAAIAFNPIVKPGVIGKGSMTLAAGSLMTGNPGVAATMAAGAAVTSPRIAGNVASLANSMGQARKWLVSQAPELRSTLLQNPTAIAAFTRTAMQSPMIQDDAKNWAMQQAQSVMQGGAPPMMTPGGQRGQ